MANATTLSVTPIDTATATDPSLCRISGYLKNAHGQALAGWAFVLRYCNVPMGLTTDTLILQERLTIKADSDGYVEFDLIRGAEVGVELPNLLTWMHKVVTVPDSASSDLLDFLFPYLVSVEFEDPTARAVSVGEYVNAALIGTLSNGETVAVPGSAATYVSSDEAVLVAAILPSFKALAAGSVSLEVTEVDRAAVDGNETREEEALSFFDLPAVILPAAPLSVTVTA